ncbi:TIGR02678 family protein [Allosalinactinospora lopnorensis]|uniref:TIGR02678 family protein n=1 Tax=Allosalinactinospora lopnorensis TaxID=1352348 RepID=UPI0006975605|nr:TIGR02678 family protein [Allosalinactinospora lopnorensis]
MASSDDVALTGERQTAARRLLADPVITARTHPDEFAVIRTHSDWLIQQFDRVLGYELTVAAGHARLAKEGLVHSVTQPLTRHSGARFSPRTYSYLALCLAVLVEAPPKLPLSRLAADVREAAAEAGLGLDPTDRMSERRAFAAAVRHLAGLGAVTAHGGVPAAHTAGGDEDAWLEVDPEVTRRVVAHLPLSTSDPGEFLADMEGEDPSGDAAAEVALRRLLAETAVVYRDDLSERQRERLGRHQWRAVAELGALLGCDAEIRAEGIALIMPDDAEAERVAVFPSSDPVGQAALLLVERLIARIPPESVPAWTVPVPAELLETEITAVLDPEAGPRRRWARTAFSHVPEPEDLTTRVLELLQDARLMRRSPPDASRYEGWSLLAAAARYGGRPYHADGSAGGRGEDA